jgi:FkbM family methyltransferase
MNKLILPNGKPLFFLDKLTALDIYREVYEEQDYFQAGIAIQDGDTVFDIGANIGLFSRYIIEHFPNCHVYAFEPVPVINEVCEANIAEFGSNIHHFKIGLSDKEEQIEFNYYPKVSADSAAIPFDWDYKVEHYVRNWALVTKGIPLAKFVPLKWRKGIITRVLKSMYKPIKIQCQLRPLSAIIQENDVKRIDLLKIDAENYERQVIAGISEADWPKIRQIAMEVHQHITGGQSLVQEFTEFLNTHGFQTQIGKEYLAPGSGVFMLYAKRS